MWSEHVGLKVAQFWPLGQYVLIKKEVDRVTSGGLIIPDIARKDTKRGVVVAVGGGYTYPDTGVHEPCPVKVGERVLVMWSSGRKIVFADQGEGEEYRVHQMHSILGVME